MLFVIYGHLLDESSYFFTITSPIKIPMFFAITGYVFKDREGSTWKFLKNLFYKLIIPWLFLSLLPLRLLKALFIDQSLITAIDYFTQFLRGKTLWYMPCCIIAEIIFF